MATTFDYDGPPVNVSNGMALQLVSQFGVKNAWFAFLKLRGMKSIHTIEGENEQKAYTYFRNKIGNLRQQINEQKNNNDEQCTIIEEEDFDNFLTSLDTLKIRNNAPEYAEIDESELIDTVDTAVSSREMDTPTTASLLRVIEQSKLKKDSVNSKKAKSNEDNPATKLQKDLSASEPGKIGKIKNQKKEDDPETKQVVEKLLAAKEEIARRHAETIDDVVSLVMEKIRNNQPFEGELSVGPTGPPKSHHKRATAMGQRLQKGSQRKSDQRIEISQMQSLAQFHPDEQGAGNATGNVVTQTNAFGISSHLPPGQIVLLHNTATGTVQLPSYSIAPVGKMHTGTGGTVIHQPISSSLTQQQISPDQSISGQFSKSVQQVGHNIEVSTGNDESHGRATTTSIPIDLAIQKNMTVQELIQTLKVQSRHQNAQIILHHNAISTTTSSQQQPQQETPDSSSQEATINEAQKFSTGNQNGSKKIAEKKSRKRKSGLNINEERFIQPTNKQSTIIDHLKKTLENGESGEAEKKRAKPKTVTAPASSIINVEDEKQMKTPAPLSNAKQNSDQKQKQQINDLEIQLQKINKQLAAEKNKSTSLKKRIDKLQSELDKSQDTIQLLQIDLACQKTDNNNLIAENIALKAENQQLRSKGQRLAAGTSTSSNPFTTSSDIGRGRKKKSFEQEVSKVKTGRGRKPTKTATDDKSTTLPEQTPPPFTLSSELGRRQSKRICVARNQYMKNIF